MADSQAIADLQKNYVCKEFADISTCFAKLHISLESKLDIKLEAVITRLSGVEKKIEVIEHLNRYKPTFVEAARAMKVSATVVRDLYQASLQNANFLSSLH